MHEKWQQMLPDYITNTLPDEQKRELEKHLKACVDCRDALEDWRMIAEVTRIKAQSLKSQLPPLPDILDGANHSHSNQEIDDFKGERPMTTLQLPQAKSRTIPWTVAAVLLLTFFFSILLLSGLNLQPTPIQPGESLTIPDEPVALFEMYIDEVWNKQNVDILSDILTEDHIHHQPSWGMWYQTGIESMVDYVNSKHRILPDVTFTTEGLTANERVVTGRVLMRYGNFQTAVPISAAITNGKISEQWFYVDSMVEAYMRDLLSRFFETLYSPVSSGEALTAADLEPFEHDLVTLHLPTGTWVGNNHDLTSAAEFWNMNHASCANWQGERKLMAQGDLVAIQEIGTCVFEAPFNYWGASLEPTGYQIQNQFTWIMRVKEGKVIEIWMYQNDPRFYGTIATLLADGNTDVDRQIEATYNLNSDVAQERATERENIKTVRIVHNEVWNSESPDEAVLEPLFTSIYQTHDHKDETINGQISSPWIAVAKVGRVWREVYPDMQVSIDRIWANGDYVTLLMTFTGTYSGTSIELGLTEPDNKVYQWDGSSTFRLEDGKIAEQWFYWDN